MPSSKYPDFTTITLTNRQTADPKQVPGHISSYPTDRTGTNFIITFDLEEEYKFTGDHAGVITDPFEGDVTITYQSVNDFVGTPSFSGSVGKNHVHIEITTDTSNKVIVDGPVTTSSKHSIPIAGGGIWAQWTICSWYLFRNSSATCLKCSTMYVFNEFSDLENGGPDSLLPLSKKP